MSPFRKLLLTLIVTICSSSTDAQVVRTFVSTTGSDANPCTRTSPCRNFNAAISAVSGNGEVVALDSGGYGPMAIDKSVSIISPEGVHAAIAPQSGVAIGITYPAERVHLKNLYLNGQGGTTGVLVTGSVVMVHLEDCVVSNFSGDGVRITRGRLHAKDSIVRNNGGGGIKITGVEFTGDSYAAIENCRLEGNNMGLIAEDFSQTTASNTMISGNFHRGVHAATAQNHSVRVALEGCQISANGVGIFGGITEASENLDASNVKVRVSNCVITHNGMAIEAQFDSEITTRVNNTVIDNNSAEVFPSTIDPN